MYMESENIAQMVEQIKQGDEKGFSSFYTQTYKYVYSRARCMFSDEDEVQDLVQEVYLAAYRNIHTLENSETIFAWLRTITFYQGTKLLKKKRKEVLISEEVEDVFDNILDEETEIEEDYMNREDIQVIRDCINNLSDEQRTVILAYYYDNLKIEEISDLLSVSEGTIKSRLYLARKNLKLHIEEQEKKRGYKLHSFGTVSLAMALGAILQENMTVSVEGGSALFGALCKELGLGAVKKTVSVSVKKGIAQKLIGLGAKKIALTTVGIVSATAITVGAAVVGIKQYGKNDQADFLQPDKQPIVQQEEKSEEKDDDASKESVIEEENAKETENMLRIKQESFDKEFARIWADYSQYKKQFEGLDIDIELECAEIHFNNDNDVDYLFHGLEKFYLLISDGNGYYLYEGLITGTHSGEYFYIEKAETIVRYASGYYDDGGFDVYQLNDLYEEEYLYYIGDECVVDISNNPILDENGELQRKYIYSDKSVRNEITEEEYKEKIYELKSKCISLYDAPYKALESFAWFKEF